MKIGERIKNRRKELGLSADELAELLGKNRATVYRYESSEIENMPTTILEPLAKALRTTPAYLMGWEDPGEKSAPTDDGRGETIKEIIKKIAQLSDSDLIQLDNFVSFLVAQSKTNTKE